VRTSIANFTRARGHIDGIEWLAEDRTRSEMEFLSRIVDRDQGRCHPTAGTKLVVGVDARLRTL